MCSGSEAGSYLKLIDFVYNSTLGLTVIKKKKKKLEVPEAVLNQFIGKLSEFRVGDRLRVVGGYHESRRCSRDTYPESCITK